MAKGRTNCRKCDCPLICLTGEARCLCVSCLKVRDRKAANRASYLKNKERRCAADRERYLRNRDARLAKAREYYQANKDAILAKKRQREMEEAGILS